MNRFHAPWKVAVRVLTALTILALLLTLVCSFVAPEASGWVWMVAACLIIAGFACIVMSAALYNEPHLHTSRVVELYTCRNTRFPDEFPSHEQLVAGCQEQAMMVLASGGTYAIGPVTRLDPRLAPQLGDVVTVMRSLRLRKKEHHATVLSIIRKDDAEAAAAL
ncbi:MAG: hypothetical protein WAQ25_04280 [Candidatus Saccharimonas sp.]